MTLKMPKPTPMQKMNRVAAVVRNNGKLPIAKAAILSGYSMSYFRWNILPSIVVFFGDIKCDGTDIWCQKEEAHA